MGVGLVFDIGGTFIRGGVYDSEQGLYSFVVRQQAPNYKSKSRDELKSALMDQIQMIQTTLLNKYDNVEYEKIGISFPGPINQNGIILNAPTLWGTKIKNIDLNHEMSKIFSAKPCFIINDITAAGYRYLNTEMETFCILTISSGVGGKIFYRGEALLDKEGMAGEVGHIYYRGKYNQLICDCGEYGHIGSMASGRGIEQLARCIIDQEEIKKTYFSSVLLQEQELTTYTIVKAIKEKDPLALFILGEAVKPIVDVINTLIFTIGIQKFILVGGFFNAVREEYHSLLCEEISRTNYRQLGKDNIENMILKGEDDDNNGLIGVGRYIFKH